MRSSGVVAAALCGIALFAAAPVMAFRLLRVDENPCGSAQNLFWPPASARISTDLLSQDEANLTLQGADAWNGSVAVFRFNSAGGNDRCNRDDGIVGIGFSSTDCNGRDLGGALGVTVSVFRTDHGGLGQLVDASITFNPNAPALNDDAVFEQAAAHELGHVLGLDHSNTCGDSGAGTLMNSTIFLDQPRLTGPQADDIAGANTIYASSGGGGGNFSNSCALGNGSGAMPAAALLIGAMLLWMRGRREARSAEPRSPRRRRRDPASRASR